MLTWNIFQQKNIQEISASGMLYTACSWQTFSAKISTAMRIKNGYKRCGARVLNLEGAIQTCVSCGFARKFEQEYLHN